MRLIALVININAMFVQYFAAVLSTCSAIIRLHFYLFTCDSVSRGQEVGAVYQSSPRLSRGGGRWPIARHSCCTCAGVNALWLVCARGPALVWRQSAPCESAGDEFGARALPVGEGDGRTDPAVGPQQTCSFTGRSDGWTRRTTRRKRSKRIYNTGFTDNCGLLPAFSWRLTGASNL